ncbi:hypothetical protein P280DRAFT_508535 [Massarina eburnea CBS 473.64]|uniref:Uncharacterized protein n=1 Tax=Massarina eburnea CBS 473.64 TaxID=1395130 RepID=A0A6A6RT50_9PLEO|nr:hypothetical protein P280DRAFT_508535 [Massarina eburnea CBS 473.64]
MHSSHPSEPPREPVYLDEFGGRHHPPPTPDYERRVPPPRYEDISGKPERRRRAQTYRAPPLPRSLSTSPSPPPRYRTPRSPRLSPQKPIPGPADTYNDYYAPRRRHAREEDYYSDNRHNRPRRREEFYDPVARTRNQAPPLDHRVYRDHRDHRDHRGHREHREKRPETERARYDERRDRRAPRPKPERKESKWQKEAKDMFVEYAVPVIKAEGGKYISKQIGNLITRKRDV